MDIYKLLTMPKSAHCFDADNRMKVCRFIDKYVTKLQGTPVISTWFAKNEGKTIFDLITRPRRQHNSQRKEDSRASTIVWDGVNRDRVSNSITRFERDGRHYSERTECDFGKHQRMNGLIMLKRRDDHCNADNVSVFSLDNQNSLFSRIIFCYSFLLLSNSAGIDSLIDCLRGLLCFWLRGREQWLVFLRPEKI